MSTHIMKFDNEQQYEQFTGSTSFVKPNISAFEDDTDPKYNPLS